MNRRLVQITLSALVLAAALISQGHSAPSISAAGTTSEVLYQRLHDKLMEWVDSKQWARGDGYIYTVEIGQLLTHAARSRDEKLYQTMRDHVVTNLLRNDPSDPYTLGFVLWRFKPGAPPEASGTTEGLRVAQGLWLGAKAFGNPSDRDLAVLIVNGYARHAIVDQGIWLIRNYFNLGTRAFATNSFLVDYDPDFVKEMAVELGNKGLQDVATESYKLVRQAAAPSGLLHQIIQPEVFTLFADVNLTVFSPNDLIQVSDSCTVAERAVLDTPEAGQRVLAFALQRGVPLHLVYRGTTGEAAVNREPELETYACLVRLAEKLKNTQARDLYLPTLIARMEEWLKNPQFVRLYRSSEVLEALYAVMAASAPPPVAGATLLSPADGFATTDMAPLLTWSNPVSATQVHLQIVPARNDGPGIDLILGPGQSYKVAAPEFGVGNYVLLPGMTYLWRVRTASATTALPASDPGWSAWSGRTIKTPAPSSATISLVSPAQGTVIATRTPTVRWANSDKRIFYYELQVSSDLQFNTDPSSATAMVYSSLLHGAVTTPENSYTVPSAFPLETKHSYFWRLRPRVQGDGQPVAWSDVWSFYVDVEPSATAGAPP